VLAKIAALPQPDRAKGERLHSIIKANAPALSSKTWYGMPAYAKGQRRLLLSECADVQDEVRDAAPLLALLVTLASGVFAATEVNLRRRRLMCAEKSFSRWMR